MLIIDGIVKVGHWAWTSCISKLLDEDLVEVIHEFFRLLLFGSKWGSPRRPLEAYVYIYAHTMNEVIDDTNFFSWIRFSFFLALDPCKAAIGFL